MDRAPLLYYREKWHTTVYIQMNEPVLETFIISHTKGIYYIYLV